MSLGIFTPAISKNVGAKSMFKTMSFILDENKIDQVYWLSLFNSLEKGELKSKKESILPNVYTYRPLLLFFFFHFIPLIFDPKF